MRIARLAGVGLNAPAFNMLEWNIQSRGHACHVTGKGFAEGDVFHTALIETRHGFERLDLSPSAWKEQGAEIIARSGFVSHWVGTYEPPPAAAPEAIRRDDAESLLRALLELRDPRHEGAVFILAAMLERKRLLKIKGHSRETGRRVTLYEHPKSGDIFAVTDPGLQLSQLESVQRDVAMLLEHGLPQRTPEEGAKDPAPAEATAGPSEEPFIPPSETASLAPA
jgi:hypothetical protein